jgi:hypothetical protein
MAVLSLEILVIRWSFKKSDTPKVGKSSLRVKAHDRQRNKDQERMSMIVILTLLMSSCLPRLLDIAGSPII